MLYIIYTSHTYSDKDLQFGIFRLMESNVFNNQDIYVVIIVKKFTVSSGV